MPEAHYRVTEGFAVFDENSIPRSFAIGDFVPGNDPIVRTHLQYLEPISELIERTTSAPGERRPTRMPSGASVKEATKARDTRTGTRNK